MSERDICYSGVCFNVGAFLSAALDFRALYSLAVAAVFAALWIGFEVGIREEPPRDR